MKSVHSLTTLFISGTRQTIALKETVGLFKRATCYWVMKSWGMHGKPVLTSFEVGMAIRDT